MTKHATWLALLAVGLASGCSSDDNELDDVQSVDAQPETDSAVTTIPVPAALDAASRAYRFDYAMPAVTSGDTVARAQLFEPAGDAPDTGFPLVVWAHGTTGIANACAPSLSFEQFGNEVAIDSLLSAGYAVLLPDYEGFGTPSIHPYYVRVKSCECRPGSRTCSASSRRCDSERRLGDCRSFPGRACRARDSSC